MMRTPHLSRWLVVPGLVATVVLTGTAQTRDRAAVPDIYKWNLTDLYPNEAAWQAEKAAIAKVVPSLAQFKGKLGSSAAVLADALEKASSLDKTMSKLVRVRGIAVRPGHARCGAPWRCSSRSIQMYTRFRREASYIEPEVLRLPAGTVDKFVAAEPRLKATASTRKTSRAARRTR